MDVIQVKSLTKDYGEGRGVFDLSFSVRKGEILGFLGPNGAGKTTTIRQLMGFIRPDSGTCTVAGLDCEKDTARIQEKLGYLPGEIAFMDDMNGKQFIHFIGEMKGITDFTRAEELISYFELNPSGSIKKMSKGMKQKIGIVCAFMQNPEILILDEPTSGLDPLMQNKFVDLVLSEKKKGTTILMSSHMFEEVERTCDRTAIIKAGKLMAVEDMASLKENRSRSYVVTFRDEAMAEQFLSEGFVVEGHSGRQVKVGIKGEVMPFITAMAKYRVTGLDVSTVTIEDMFMHFYGGEGKADA